MALSGDKVVELQKLQRLLSLLEKTFAASKNEEQKKARIKGYSKIQINDTNYIPRRNSG